MKSRGQRYVLLYMRLHVSHVPWFILAKQSKNILMHEIVIQMSQETNNN